MGVMPGEFKRMTVWELSAVTERWIEAHDTGERGMSKAEQDEMWEWMQSKPKVPLTHRKNGHG
jgi:hypothetical protein